MASSDGQSAGGGGWETLPRERVALGGGGGTDAMGWFARIATLALVLAAGWLVFTATRPLAAPETPEEIEIRAVRGVEFHETPMERRVELLASVGAKNWFDPNGEVWSFEDVDARVADAEASEDPGESESAEQAPSVTQDPLVAELIGTLHVTRVEDMPTDLVGAYRNLELRGIVGDRDGGLVAMISTVRSKSRPATRSFRPGETFIDEDFPDEEWRLVLIDRERDRVVLRRNETNVLLRLYKAPATVARGTETPEEGADSEIGLSKEEIASQLRAAGYSEEEIAELLLLAEALEGAPDTPAAEEPGLARGESLSEAVEEVQEKAPELGAVVSMMRDSGPARPRRDRKSRNKLSFPDVDTYPGVGSGHKLATIDAEARMLTLEDGTQWRIAESYVGVARRWRSSAPVAVFRGYGTSTPYVITNQMTSDVIEVEHIVVGSDASEAEPEAEAPGDG